MRKLISGCIALLASAAPLHAQYSLEWFDGTWSCTVGGAQGTFVWGPGEGDPAAKQPSCGQGCNQSDGGVTGGHFLVMGLATTYLTEESSNNQAAFLAGPNGITWFLQRNGKGFIGRAGDGTNFANLSCSRPLRVPPGATQWHSH